MAPVLQPSSEVKTLKAMITISCRANHRTGAEAPCQHCRELLEYALVRLERCVHGTAKPPCRDCPVHCYAPEQREAIRRVMRTAGPRMLLRHPVLTLRHLLRL